MQAGTIRRSRSIRSTTIAFLVLISALGATLLSASHHHQVQAEDELPSVSLTSVKTGSVAWLIDTMEHEKLDTKHGFDLKVRQIANSPAAPIALLSGEADVIVSDWTWAMRQRAKGLDLKFAPYSEALGSLVVPKGSDIKNLADLKGKKIGIAGSAVDKSWVLLRAYGREKIGADLADVAQPVYGAPPLIAEELRNRRIDACLNFWTYAARLVGFGAREIIGMEDVIRGLGVDPPPALVGFVWSEKNIEDNKVPINKLLAAVDDANAILAKSDEAWERLRPLIKAKSEAEFVAIRDYYRSGITDGWDQADTQSAKKLTNLLSELGDIKLGGNDTRFDPELFYIANE